MLVLPFLLPEDPPLLRSMEVFINIRKYLLHKVPKGFPDSNAKIILYFCIHILVKCEYCLAVLLFGGLHFRI